MLQNAPARGLAFSSLLALVACNAILGNKDRPLASDGAAGIVDPAGASGSSHSGSAGKASRSGSSSGAAGGEIDDNAGDSAGGTAGAGADTAGSSSAAGGGTIGSAGSAGIGPIGGGGTSGSAGGGVAGSAGKGSGGTTGTAGSGAAGGRAGGGGAGGGGAGGGSGSAGSGGAAVTPPLLVTSTLGTYWKTDGTLTASTAVATVTVNDAAPAQKWDGFGAAFNELGWTALTSVSMKVQAIKLLFSATEGAAFAWGRIPIGANDYAAARYTADDTGSDVAPSANEANRPSADPQLTAFNLTQDGVNLIPYIQAAQGVKPDLRFWASAWTPPVWMKTGYNSSLKPSYFDGGSMKGDAATLAAYASYFSKFIAGYKAQGINIEIVAPQTEPSYQQNYPSCLWDKATYLSFVGQYLGPAMKAINVQLMLGTLANSSSSADLDISTAVLSDATAKTFISRVGVEWGVLEEVNRGTTFGSLPIWATEHKGGNYPWNPSDFPPYNSTQAPNDLAYGIESWGYVRDAITKGGVTSYNAWNMVLNKSGLGIDTVRDWKQNALLVADGGTVTPTAAYYVFRHLSQYAAPNATVVGTTGGDAVAFKNPDGSLVVVMFNSGVANSAYVVAIGGKKFQFGMPANGWATVKYKP